MKTVKRFIKVDNGKLSKVIEYESGSRVEIPKKKDGSIRWYQKKKKKKNN